jgi:hypothetical protein
MEGQPNWSVDVSIRATADLLSPYVESIRGLDPAVRVEVEGPSQVGVCLVRVHGPFAVSDDVNMVFEAFERDHPGLILRDYLT